MNGGCRLPALSSRHGEIAATRFVGKSKRGQFRLGFPPGRGLCVTSFGRPCLRLLSGSFDAKMKRARLPILAAAVTLCAATLHAQNNNHTPGTVVSCGAWT